MADAARIEIVRWDPSAAEPASMLRVDGTQQPEQVVLQDLDVVKVPSVEDHRPVAFFEGALVPDDKAPPPPGTDTTRIRYPFAEGETLGDAALSIRARFSGDSDIEHALLVRAEGGQRIPVNLSVLMSGGDPDSNLPLMQFDTIVIPRKEFLITVSGAVLKPGRYPYAPAKSWAYYVDLAGGFDPSKHSGDAVAILDGRDRAVPSDRPIEPDNRIVAPANYPMYIIGPISEAVTAVGTVLTLILAVIQMAR